MPKGIPNAGKRAPSAKRCLACTHNKRPAIDRDIVLNAGTLDELGEKYGVSRYVIHRHKPHIDEATKRRILAQQLRDEKVAEHQQVADVINDEKGEIEKELRWCLKKVRAVVERAEEDENDPMILAGAKELRAALVDLAKLTGILKQNLSVTVSLTESSPEWLTLRAILVQVFRDHPEAERQFVELAKPLRITDGRHLHE